MQLSRFIQQIFGLELTIAVGLECLLWDLAGSFEYEWDSNEQIGIRCLSRVNKGAYGIGKAKM